MDKSAEQVASEVVARLQRAWNTADAQGFASAFADDADFIHILGGHGRGHATIADAHRMLFGGIYCGSQVRFELAGIRCLGPDALLVLLIQTVIFGSPQNSHQMTCRPSLTLVRNGGEWAVVLMQNTRIVDTLPDWLSNHPFARLTEEDAL